MTAEARKDRVCMLVVDDEVIVRESLEGWFTEDGYDVNTADSARAALRLAAENHYDIALIDIKMPNVDGLELQSRLAEVAPDLTVIIMTAYATVETAVTALKAGAYDYIVKPFDPDELSHLELIDAVAPTDATVLIQGESGTGKELVARAIHARSPRRYNPIVEVHCGALAEGILESELFGHEKGAFTGANYRHKGKFEQADGGTIFLDEIADISARVQVELLRIVEEKRVTRVGGKHSTPVDFRIVAASNRDLREEVKAGRFRDDLFWRLDVVPIELPPLRERTADIPRLAEHFLERFCKSMNRKGLSFAREALEALQAYHWPGNVRELQNAIERAVVLGTPPKIESGDLPHYVTDRTGAHPSTGSLADMERAHIEAVLAQHEWNISRAARTLEVDRGTLYNKIHKYGLKKPEHA
jgi:DNA-binding NtrC family response regulator